MFSNEKKCCHDVRMLSPNKSCSKDNLDCVIYVQQYNYPLIHQQLRESKILAVIHIYTYTYTYIYIYIITEDQVSRVIIVLLLQIKLFCVVQGPHSSGNFDD